MSTISDRIVPRSGHGAWLVWLGAGAMAFLAVFTLALSVSAERLADSWSAALAQSATVRISAPPAELNAQTDATLEVLRTTPGIDDARVMSAQEQADLLAVWLGPDLPLDALPLPRMIEVFESAEGPDRQGLRLRLSAEAPGAIYDDHTQWRRPLIEAAARLRALSLLALALIGGVTGAIIALAASGGAGVERTGYPGVASGGGARPFHRPCLCAPHDAPRRPWGHNRHSAWDGIGNGACQALGQRQQAGWGFRAQAGLHPWQSPFWRRWWHGRRPWRRLLPY